MVITCARSNDLLNARAGLAALEGTAHGPGSKFSRCKEGKPPMIAPESPEDKRLMCLQSFSAPNSNDTPDQMLRVSDINFALE